MGKEFRIEIKKWRKIEKKEDLRKKRTEKERDFQRITSKKGRKRGKKYF